MTPTPQGRLPIQDKQIDIIIKAFIHHLPTEVSKLNFLGAMESLDLSITTKDLEKADLVSEVERLKKSNERYLWNLGGCSTYALGYGLDEPHDKEMALPALEDVLKLAKEKAELEKEIERLKEYINTWTGDPDLKAQLSEKDARIAELEKEITEWICQHCRMVFPKPKEFHIDNPCPNCSRQIFPRGIIERVEQREKISNLENLLHEIAGCLRGLKQFSSPDIQGIIDTTLTKYNSFIGGGK